MLTLIVPGDEYFDEASQEFVTIGDVRLELEHSLASLSKWESVYEKAFLGKNEKTREEVLDYVKYMILTPDFLPEVLSRITDENYNIVNDYINAKQTATWFADTKSSSSSETITAELIYYWMVSHNIPFECQYWHLNRLFTLIRVCNVKNSKPEKMSRSEIAARNRELNAQRRAQMGTRG